MNDASIQNLWLISNANKCGDLDDIILSYENADGNNVTYLMQLKHGKKTKTIKRREFVIESGDFSLPKYYDSMKHIKREIDLESSTKSDVRKHLDRNRNSMVYILFTPRRIPKCDYLITVSEASNAESAWSLHKCINTNGQIFSFDYEKLNFKVQREYRHWMNNFYLFTEQITVDKADAVIQSYIAKLIRPITISKSVMDELYQKFIPFLYQWSKGNVGGFYPITRTIILKVLFECLIKPYMWNFEVSKPNDNGCDNSFSCVSQSVITVIHSDRVVMQFLRNHLYRIIKEYIDVKEHKVLWKRHPEIISKEILRVTRRYKKITMEVAYEYLWKTNKLPLILKVHDNNSYKLLLQLLKVFHGIFKVIVLTDNVPNTSDNMEICSSLTDLSERNRIFILNYPVRLQNRKFIQLVSFIQPENFHVITMKDIIYILMDQFNIGDSPPPTPEIFIQQSFEPIWMKWDVLKNVIGDKFIIHCRSSENLNVLLNEVGMSLEEATISIWQPDLQNLSKCRIIIVFDFCGIAEIVKKWHNFNVHFLIFHECLELEWINTCGAHTNISNYRKVTSCHCLNHPRTFAEFHSVVKVMSLECIIISAYPGMGKSVMLTHIANMAPTDRWLLRVNLLDHTSYYKEKFTSVDHIQYFARSSITNPLAQLVFDFHVKSKKVMLLFDEFDEVPENLQKKVVEMVLECNKLSCSIYLTTRTNKQPLLEDSLKTFTREITPFSDEDQLQYLMKYFTSNCSSVDTDELIRNFSGKLLDAASRNLKNRDREFTGIPLQTKLLCEVFKKDCDNYLRTKSFEQKPFDLIYLYKHFIREKSDIICPKCEKYFEDILNILKECRTLYALQSIFEKEDLEGLNIDERLNQILSVLPHLLQKDGIIIVRNDTEVRFIHRTFAEYLVAKWLSKNVINERNKEIIIRLVKKTFDNDFITVRNMFDRLMAKNSPLHLAIIDGDVNIIESILKTKEDSVLPLDGGGRSPFHLLPSWRKFRTKSENSHILNLLGKVECKIAYILNYTPIEYALLNGSFWFADFFCSRLKTLDRCVVSICEVCDIVLEFGWPFRNCHFQYLGLICLICQITNELSLEEQVFYDQIPDELGFTPLHLASYCGEPQVIRELLKQNADVNAYDKYRRTPLHWTAVKGRLNAVEVLLSNSADVNLPDKNAMNVLHYVFMLNVERGAEIISILLEKNGDLNKKDKYGIPPLYYAFYFNRQKFIAHLPAIIANLTRNNLSLTDIDCREYGNVLHWAVRVGEKDTVKLILDFGANVNVGNYCGRTPLHLACENGNLKLAKFLILNNANVKAKDKRRNYGSWDAYNWFQRNKVNFDNCGRTPLHLACENGNLELVKFLISKGAIVNEEDDEGRSPVDDAISSRRSEVIDYLRTKCAFTTKQEEDVLLAKASDAELCNLMIKKGFKLLSVLLDKLSTTSTGENSDL